MLYHLFLELDVGGDVENRRRGNQWDERFNMKATWSLGINQRSEKSQKYDILWMRLVRLHSLPTPSDERKIPNL
jgi:hypothetical protein